MDEDEDAREDVVEIDRDHFIEVEITREWPQYVATWTVRRRAGESDYPVGSGRVERMPPEDPAQVDAMLDALRADARGSAMQRAAELSPGASGEGKGSFLGRLFGRRSG